VARPGEWSNDWQLRSNRRARGRQGVEPHDHVTSKARVRLPGRLQHRTYRSLSEHIQTTDRFSARMARSYAEKGRFAPDLFACRALLQGLR
jgi:hypothetical protein